jgi:hypothetical protein
MSKKDKNQPFSQRIDFISKSNLSKKEKSQLLKLLLTEDDEENEEKIQPIHPNRYLEKHTEHIKNHTFIKKISSCCKSSCCCCKYCYKGLYYILYYSMWFILFFTIFTMAVFSVNTIAGLIYYIFSK